MKQILLACLLCIFTISLFAETHENLSYVKSGGKMYFGTIIKSGIFNTRVTNAEGKTFNIPNTRVDAMVDNGRMYERMPLVCKEKGIECMVLMEYITGRNGLRLYRYACYNEHCDLANGIIEKAHPENMYFVYLDGKIHLRIDASNAEKILPYFGIKVSV